VTKIDLIEYLAKKNSEPPTSKKPTKKGPVSSKNGAKSSRHA